MLSDLIDSYLVSLVDTRSQQTIAWYRKRLSPLRQLTQNISSITLFDLQAIYSTLANRQTKYVDHPSGRASQSGPLAPSTLRGYVRSWRVFFIWLVDNGFITFSPARKLKLPKIPRQPPKAIKREDMDRILEAALISSERDYAIVCLLSDSACRVGGLCAITLDNIDLATKSAFVTEKGEPRLLLFGERTACAILNYLSVRPQVTYRELFIGQKNIPLRPRGVHALLDRLALSAGVTDRHNPHSFRHGWARAALRSGAELTQVAQYMGHHQVQTTYEYYGRWDISELQELRARFSWLPPDQQLTFDALLAESAKMEDILPTANQAD